MITKMLLHTLAGALLVGALALGWQATGHAGLGPATPGQEEGDDRDDD